ncbi:MAG: hypothetical protein P8R42_23985 [Candidatus Binatia bacterium]|nr:hypothetical protein [Candidatus Binatia bacterium]
MKPTKSRHEGIGVEELVVTAQKRAQDIQDVPISMTALTRSMRQKEAHAYVR